MNRLDRRACRATFTTPARWRTLRRVVGKLRAQSKGVSFVVLLFAVATLPAISAFRVNVPFAVRITAYVNEKAEGVNPDFTWIVANGATEYKLYIVNLLVVDGELLPGDINQAVEPYHVSFQLEGEKDTLRKLKTAPPRKAVVINASLSVGEGGRYMMLNTVEPAAGPTASDTPVSGMK